jgi:zinc/manganese transport system substrate-binding protein
MKVGGELFSDALSEGDGPAPTYTDKMRYNARTIVEAIGAGS